MIDKSSPLYTAWLESRVTYLEQSIRDYLRMRNKVMSMWVGSSESLRQAKADAAVKLEEALGDDD